ncbi:NAT9 acetyltransferase, partial [Polypterus senegalus]
MDVQSWHEESYHQSGARLGGLCVFRFQSSACDCAPLPSGTASSILPFGLKFRVVVGCPQHSEILTRVASVTHKQTCAPEHRTGKLTTRHSTSEQIKQRDTANRHRAQLGSRGGVTTGQGSPGEAWLILADAKQKPGLATQVTTRWRSKPRQRVHRVQNEWGECTFIILDKKRWADPRVAEEDCMVGDVNLFLTDSEDPSLGEIEIMIAGITRLGIHKFEAKIGKENQVSLALFQKLHFQEVSYSEAFQESTLELRIDEEHEKRLAGDRSLMEEKNYRETKAAIRPETAVHPRI